MIPWATNIADAYLETKAANNFGVRAGHLQSISCIVS